MINAGDGTHEHPTQGLLDLLTLRDRFKSFEGLRVCICGDVLHSRVARSNIWGLKKLGADVAVCGPKSLLPSAIGEFGVTVFRRIEEAIEWAQALNILRLQLERMTAGYIPSLREYNRVFGVTRERLDRAPRDLVIMHPGPMNRGVEIDSDVADGPAFGDPRPGDERRGGANGGALSARRRQAGTRRGREGRRRTMNPISAAQRRAPPRSRAEHRRAGRRAGHRREDRARRRYDRGRRRCAGDRLHRLVRHARFRGRALSPARARSRGCGDDRDRCARRGGRRIHRDLRDAQHGSRHRQSGGGGIHHSPGDARGRGARVSDRRDLGGAERRSARRVRRDGGRGRDRGERRRQARRERATDAHRARVRADVQHSRDRPL